MGGDGTDGDDDDCDDDDGDDKKDKNDKKDDSLQPKHVVVGAKRHADTSSTELNAIMKPLKLVKQS
jgi:hypothetical protein